MPTTTYFVPNINCHHCVHTIKMELEDIQGVQAVDADVQTRTVKVTFDPPVTSEKIESTLAEINYPVASPQ